MLAPVIIIIVFPGEKKLFLVLPIEELSNLSADRAAEMFRG
jgi:hypothetical protein